MFERSGYHEIEKRRASPRHHVYRWVARGGSLLMHVDGPATMENEECQRILALGSLKAVLFQRSPTYKTG